MDKPYVYVVVRSDISSEQQIVQASHAILEASQKFGYPKHKTSIIILEAKNKEDLFSAHHYLNKNNINNYMFYEPDFEMGESALATEALYGENRKILRKFKLINHKRKD